MPGVHQSSTLQTTMQKCEKLFAKNSIDMPEHMYNIDKKGINMTLYSTAGSCRPRVSAIGCNGGMVKNSHGYRCQKCIRKFSPLILYFLGQIMLPDLMESKSVGAEMVCFTFWLVEWQNIPDVLERAFH